MTKPNASAYDQALTLLAFRARAEGELRRQLIRKGADAVEVEEALQRLRDQKLLDDDDFARQFARGRMAGSGASRRRIVQELGRKGVAREVANRAITELVEEEGVDPAASVQRVAAKKWRALAGLDDATRRRRLYAFLARRGFDPDEIREVMADLGTDTDV